jgi:hypothetical protein
MYRNDKYPQQWSDCSLYFHRLYANQRLSLSQMTVGLRGRLVQKSGEMLLTTRVRPNDIHHAAKADVKLSWYLYKDGLCPKCRHQAPFNFHHHTIKIEIFNHHENLTTRYAHGWAQCFCCPFECSQWYVLDSELSQ